MTSIPLSDLFLIVFVLVDDWYQCTGKHQIKGKPGAKPAFTDSEVLTLMLMQDFIPYPSETPLEPLLVTQARTHRRRIPRNPGCQAQHRTLVSQDRAWVGYSRHCQARQPHLAALVMVRLRC